VYREPIRKRYTFNVVEIRQLGLFSALNSNLSISLPLNKTKGRIKQELLIASTTDIYSQFSGD